MLSDFQKSAMCIPIRKKYIDAVKGLCILLVVITHAGGIPVIGGALTACYMQVFFFVGGFTYKERDGETFLNFTAKKVKRLLVPYIVYATILLIIDTLLDKRNMTEFLVGGGGVLYARHCLFLYKGHENNLFMLNNLNEQLWFLPAMFLTYLLFWIIVKASKSKRAILIVVYLCINSTTLFLPILLPWSLDVVFITSIIMYLGYCSKKYIYKLENLNMKSLYKSKALIMLLCMTLAYCIAVKVNGEINTSVRIFGDYKILSIFLYVIIGYIGAFVIIATFSACENTYLIYKIVDGFAYFGRRTIEILAVNMLAFRVVEKLLSHICLSNGNIEYICKITTAVIAGVVLNNIVETVISHVNIKIKDAKHG